MNSEMLLQALRDGASLRERWKSRSSAIQTAKKQIILKRTDGNEEFIQRSCLTPLIKKGLVTSQLWSGDNYVYRLNE